MIAEPIFYANRNHFEITIPTNTIPREAESIRIVFLDPMRDRDAAIVSFRERVKGELDIMLNRTRPTFWMRVKRFFGGK